MLDCQQAIDDFGQAIELDPQNVSAYFVRGLVHRELGQVREAVADFERLLELETEPRMREEAEKQL